MMLRYSFDMIDEANDIENAVNKVLDKGFRTVDIAGKDEGVTKVSCSEMGDLVCAEI